MKNSLRMSLVNAIQQKSASKKMSMFDTVGSSILKKKESVFKSA